MTSKTTKKKKERKGERDGGKSEYDYILGTLCTNYIESSILPFGFPDIVLNKLILEFKFQRHFHVLGDS